MLRTRSAARADGSHWPSVVAGACPSERVAEAAPAQAAAGRKRCGCQRLAGVQAAAVGWAGDAHDDGGGGICWRDYIACRLGRGRQQGLIRRRVAALPFVDQFAYESQAEAFEKYREAFRNQPQMLRGVTPRVLPASFRVVLHEPRQFSELFREFCPQLGPDGKPACVEGVDEVVDQHQVVWSTLAGPWLHTTDAAVLLAPGVDPNRQEAIRREPVAVVVVVQFDFAAAAAGRFQQSGVQDPVALDKVAFDSFRVRLRDPRQFRRCTVGCAVEGGPSPQSPSASPESDRKSTRLNSSHVKISYAVFCLKKKKKKNIYTGIKFKNIKNKNKK